MPRTIQLIAPHPALWALSVLLALLLGLSLGAGAAQAAEPLSWSAPLSFDPGHSLDSMSCISTSPCTAPARIAPHTLQIVLNGPLTNAQYNVVYTYTVDVTSPMSYRAATINFFAPTFGRQIRHMNLRPHQTWKGTFRAEFESLVDMKGGLSISIFPSPKTSHSPLFGKRYVVTPAQASAQASRHSLSPGIHLVSGTLKEVLLDHSYTYKFETLPTKSYKDAIMWLTIPPALYVKHFTVNLQAHKPFIERFTTKFKCQQPMPFNGITLSFVTAASKQGSRTIFIKTYSMTPAPGQTDSPDCDKPRGITRIVDRTKTHRN